MQGLNSMRNMIFDRLTLMTCVVGALLVVFVAFSASTLASEKREQINLKKPNEFRGYLFARLAAWGSKSEGPAYFLQQGETKYVPIKKHVEPWKSDPMLHKHLNTKVVIIGKLVDKTIHYRSISPMKP